MNITSCTLTSHIAKSFKAYHTIRTPNTRNNPKNESIDQRSNSRWSSTSFCRIKFTLPRINLWKKSIDPTVPLKTLSNFLSRLPETAFPFSESGRGKERPRRRIVACLEASKIEMRTRAFPFACVRCQRACTRRAHARVRAHCTHAATHAHVQACRRARNVGIT